MGKKKDKVALKALTMVSTQLSANHFPGQLWPPAVKRPWVAVLLSIEVCSIFTAGCVSEAPFRMSFVKVCSDKSGAVQQALMHHLRMADGAGGIRLCSAVRGRLSGRTWTHNEGGKRTPLNFMSPLLFRTVWVPSSRCVRWASAL